MDNKYPKGNDRSLERREVTGQKKNNWGLTLYGHEGHLGHVTWIFIHTCIFLQPSYRCVILNFALIGQAVSEENMFEYYDNIYVIARGLSQMSPWGPFFLFFFQN